MAVAKSMMLPAGSSLTQLLGESLAGEAKEAMLKRGVPEAVTERFRPWAIIVSLSMPPQSSGEFLDKVLYQRAQENGKRFKALETPQEQLSVFMGLSVEEQADMLRNVLAEYESYPQLFELMTEAYLAGDLERLVEINEGTPVSNDAATQERFMNALLSKRNHRMVQRILPLTQGRKLFVGVGALHLPGKDGLINLFRHRGYKVVSVK